MSIMLLDPTTSGGQLDHSKDVTRWERKGTLARFYEADCGKVKKIKDMREIELYRFNTMVVFIEAFM